MFIDAGQAGSQLEAGLAGERNPSKISHPALYPEQLWETTMGPESRQVLRAMMQIAADSCLWATPSPCASLRERLLGAANIDIMTLTMACLMRYAYQATRLVQYIGICMTLKSRSHVNAASGKEEVKESGDHLAPTNNFRRST